MYIGIEKEGNSGSRLYIKVSNVKNVIFYDDLGAVTQVGEDFALSKPEKRKPNPHNFEVT